MIIFFVKVVLILLLLLFLYLLKSFIDYSVNFCIAMKNIEDEEITVERLRDILGDTNEYYSDEELQQDADFFNDIAKLDSQLVYTVTFVVTVIFGLVLFFFYLLLGFYILKFVIGF